MRPFNQAEFDAFRADPKRQALVDRILSDERPATDHELAGLQAGRTIPDDAMVPTGWHPQPARTIEPCIDRSGRRI